MRIRRLLGDSGALSPMAPSQRPRGWKPVSTLQYDRNHRTVTRPLVFAEEQRLHRHAVPRLMYRTAAVTPFAAYNRAAAASATAARPTWGPRAESRRAVPSRLHPHLGWPPRPPFNISATMGDGSFGPHFVALGSSGQRKGSCTTWPGVCAVVRTSSAARRTARWVSSSPTPP